ncbi:uncharacterized protein [Nicotiana sylvestris]|uniref:uncharacterized protein n=1 Tax=Nicotiana sylvestris TaxID=4096 RepID=UPI00388C3C20
MTQNQVIEGFGVSKVLDSDNPDFKPGDIISGFTGWEEYSLIYKIEQLRKIQADDIPLMYHVGLLGCEEVRCILSRFFINLLATMVNSVPETSSATTYTPEPSSPLFLLPSDVPDISLIPLPFSGTGFGRWRRSMIVSLSARNKIGFIDGSCAKPTENFLNIGSGIGTLDIASYFNKLKKLWDELGIMCSSYANSCVCAAKVGLQEENEEDKVDQFLMGINEVYIGVRSNILMMQPAPSLDTVYNIMLQDEKQSQVIPNTQFNSESASFNANFNKPSPQFPPQKQYTQRVNFDQNGQKVNFDQTKVSLPCKYCKKNLVTQLKNVTNYMDFLQISNLQRGNLEDLEQYTQLMNLLQQSTLSESSSQPNLMGSANFAGINSSSPMCLNGSSIVRILTSVAGRVWIVNSGATDHMTSNNNLLFNITPLPVPYLVSLPNGYKVKAHSMKKLLELDRMNQGLYKLYLDHFAPSGLSNSIVPDIDNFVSVFNNVVQNANFSLHANQPVMNSNSVSPLSSFPKCHRDKFHPRAFPCVFVGYPFAKKWYKLYNLQTKSILFSRDVVFHEYVFPYKIPSSAPTPSSSSPSFPLFYDTSPFVPIPPSATSSPSDDSVPSSSSPDNVLPPPSELRKSTRSHYLPSHLQDYVVNLPPSISCSTSTSTSTTQHVLVEPYSYAQAAAIPIWQEAMRQEFAALEENQTWKIVELPIGKKPIGNVNNVFLHGDLDEEVYMKLPQGLSIESSSSGSATLVCKLQKSLYGLRQASRQWYAKLSQALYSRGYSHSLNDYSLLIKRTESCSVFLAVYVVDIILTGDYLSEISALKSFLDAQFKIKNLGLLSYFLGIKVFYHKSGVFLHQKRFISDLLLEYNCLDAFEVVSPLDIAHKLHSDVAFESVFKDTLGPTYGYCFACFAILKRDFYFWVFLSNSPDFSLLASCDSDWAACHESRRFVTGFCIHLGGSFLSWKSKKQHIVSLSSAEAEYRAMSKVMAELAWLVRLLSDLGLSIDAPIPILCDSQTAIYIAKNPVFHERTKHIEVDCHFIRTKLANGLISLSHVSTSSQMADIFTKPLTEMQDVFLPNSLFF